MKNIIDNSLLNSIGVVFEKSKNLFSNTNELSLVQNELQIVSDFFEVDEKTAALFSVIVCDQLSGETSSATYIMKSMGFKPIDFIRINEILKEWKIKGFLRLRATRSSRASNDYLFADEVIDAIIYNDKSRINVKIPETQSEAFLNIKSFISKSINAVEKEILADTILDYASRFDRFPFINHVLSSNHFLIEEKAILLYIISYAQYGIQDFDLEVIMDYFDEDSVLSYTIKNRVENNQSCLFSENYLEFEIPDYVDYTLINPGIKLKEHLNLGKKIKKEFIPKYSKLIRPNEIEDVPLFFNNTNEESMNKILDITSEKFKNVTKRFADHGIKPGLTLLFYGNPGTGKTEFVKQLAKKNNRNLLLVDISSIKSKWVGESEKNIKRVFHEYKQALDSYSEIPILFFNECDAIISKRNDVNTSVDQMNNTMQNIVLQELEDFEGIFIATTNLIQNIDKAFDRRLLYKLHFEEPNSSTTENILTNFFPNIEKNILKNISETYELTGGQIQNLKKKWIVDSILHEINLESKIDFKKYINEEVGFRKNKNKSIGF